MEQGAGTTALSIVSHILLTKGGFCTPRSVIRNVTTRNKPTTAQVVEEMKRLETDGLGKFKQLSEKERVYYKPLPTEENREQLATHASFEDYKANFPVLDEKYITQAQYNRLFNKSPDKDLLTREYGYKLF